MPDTDPYDAIVFAASGSPRRVKPTTSHLDELTKFAQENKLTVGSTTGGRHNTGSLHYTGNAIDIKGSGAFDNDTVQRLSDAAKSQGFLLRDERVRPPRQRVWGGPHVHIEYAGQGQQPNLQNPYDAVVNAASGQSSPYDSVVAQTPSRSATVTRIKKLQPKGPFAGVQAGIEASRPNLAGEGAVTAKPQPGLGEQLRAASRMAGSMTGTDAVLPAGAQDAIGEQLAKGGAGLLRTASGVVKVAPRVGTLGVPTPHERILTAPIRNPLNRAAETLERAAGEAAQQSGRGEISQTVEDVGGGAIASSPAMVLQGLGVPAPVAFGVDSYLKAEGRDADWKTIVKETGLGALSGALFEIPTPIKSQLAGQILQKLAIVGVPTTAMELAAGKSLGQAITAGAVQGGFAASGARGREALKTESLTQVPDIQGKLAEREAGVSPPLQPRDVANRTALRKSGTVPPATLPAKPANITPILPRRPTPRSGERPVVPSENVSEQIGVGIQPDTGNIAVANAKIDALKRRIQETGAVKQPSPRIAAMRQRLETQLAEATSARNQLLDPKVQAQLEERPLSQVMAERRALREGVNEAQTQAQSDVAPQPKSAQPASIVEQISVPRTTEGTPRASMQESLPESTAGISQPVRAGSGLSSSETPRVVAKTKIQPKGTQADAIQEQATSKVDVRQQAGNGKALGEGNSVNKVAPKTQTPSGQEPYRAGDQKISKLALGIEAKAIEAKLTEGFKDLPQYSQVKVADQAERAASLLGEDSAKAKRIAMGQEEPPKGLLPESVLTAVENRALKDGDIETIRDLATKSSLTSEGTLMGQRIRLLGERNPNSPVSVIRDIQKARQARAQKSFGDPAKAKTEIHDQIKAEIQKAAPKIKDWHSFLDSIQC